MATRQCKENTVETALPQLCENNGQQWHDKAWQYWVGYWKQQRHANNDNARIERWHRHSIIGTMMIRQHQQHKYMSTMPTMQTANHANYTNCQPRQLPTMQTMQTANHTNYANCQPRQIYELTTMPTANRGGEVPLTKAYILGYVSSTSSGGRSLTVAR